MKHELYLYSRKADLLNLIYFYLYLFRNSFIANVYVESKIITYSLKPFHFPSLITGSVNFMSLLLY
jgi:hypothetical protein